MGENRLSFTNHGLVVLHLTSHPRCKTCSSISLGVTLGKVWRRQVPSLTSCFLQSSKNRTRRDPLSLFLYMETARAELFNTQATQDILHKTSVLNAVLKISNPGPFPVCRVYHPSACVENPSSRAKGQQRRRRKQES